MRATLGRALLIPFVLLLTAPVADAAVVQTRALEEDILRSSLPGAVQLQVIALPGESNALSILRAGDGTVVVTDAGAPLFPGRTCTGGGNEVRCPVPPSAPLSISVTGGAGDRRVSLEQLAPYESSELSGGAGNDSLIGGSGTDTLLGAEGNDVLAGGGGDDYLAPGTGADLVRGGAGVDYADYGARPEPLTVTLDDAPGDGAPGEGDDIGADVERLAGGNGPDRLVGSEGANQLSGGDGIDDLDGRGGNDTLYGENLVGGAGRDTLSAEAESSIDVRDGERDTVRCATLARPPLADPIDRLDGCVPLAIVTTRRARVDGLGRFRVRVRCEAIGQPCRLRVKVRHRGATLVRSTVRTDPGARSAVVRLDARGRAAVALERRLSACIVARSYRTVPAPSHARAACTPLELERTS